MPIEQPNEEFFHHPRDLQFADFFLPVLLSGLDGLGHEGGREPADHLEDLFVELVGPLFARAVDQGHLQKDRLPIKRQQLRINEPRFQKAQYSRSKRKCAIRPI